MPTMRRVVSVLVSFGVLAFGGCSAGAAPSGSSGSAPPPDSPTAATTQAAVVSPSPGPRFAAGDMLVVLADVQLSGETDDGPFSHALLPGDRVLVLNGPIPYGGGNRYEVAHKGIAGWVPVSDDARQLLAFDAPDPNAEVWDLFSFGDSSSPSLDVWALRIERRLGVEVRIYDVWNHGVGGTPADNLRVVRTNAAVRTAIAEAEVISIELNPGGTKTGDALGPVCVPNDPTPRDPPPVYTVADFDEFAGLWRQLYDEIFALRAGKPTIVRAIDTYVPVIASWKAAGIQAACTASWESISATVKLVAAEYDVPFASMYDAFNGPNHDQDPVANGYIGPDGIHLSESGREAQIDVLDVLGYEFVMR